MMQNRRDMMKTLGLAATAFAIAFGVIAATLPDSKPPGYSHQNWTQPDAVTPHHATPISSREWAFDFLPVSNMIQTLAAGTQRSLVIDSHTLELLNRGSSALPANLSDTDIERIEYLTRVEAPAPIAEELADTITGFLHYQQVVEGDSLSTPTTAKERFERTVALQNQHLGPNRAQQLFGEQRRLKRYLLTRQAIQADSGLSAHQRQRALERAGQEFKSASQQEGAQ